MGHYFIRVDDATDLRRKILESSKASINTLRGYQNLEKIRSQKKTLIKGLKRELKELSMLVNHLESSLPTLTKNDVSSMNEPKTPRKRSKRKTARKKALPPPPPHKSRSVYVGKPGEPRLKKPVVSLPPSKKPAVKRPEPPREETELEKLHSKLSNIERKLGNL